MGLLDSRVSYAPFEYMWAYEYWEKQQQSHWLHTEVSMNADVNDWRFNMDARERSLVGHVLKGFTQTELHVKDYWASNVYRWFPKPEIRMMAATFASFESIHAVGYSFLDQTLGLEDYGAFLHDPSTKAKMDRLIETKGKSTLDKARSLAVFSAFNEGVNLFSSFAILLNFSRFNKLKGVGTIIRWSVRDESLHSEAGCRLFRELMAEQPHLWTDEFKKEIYDAARLTVQLEDDYIDKAFEQGDVDGLSAHDLKQYIRFRTNTKLGDLNLKTNWRNIDHEAVRRITSWFEPMTSGVEQADFFAGRVTTYSKGVISFAKIWDQPKVANQDAPAAQMRAKPI